MKTDLRHAILLAALLLAGCATVNQIVGLGVVSEEKSSFDGREIVRVSDNNLLGIGGPWAGFGISIGARWESGDPDIVNLTLSQRANRFAVNLDGEITRFQIGGYDDEVAIPLAYLGRMLTAAECKLQVVQGSDTSEADFTKTSNSGAPLAKVSLKQFYERVQQKKARLTST